MVFFNQIESIKLKQIVSNRIECQTPIKNDSRGQFNWVNLISLPYRLNVIRMCDLGQVKSSEFKLHVTAAENCILHLLGMVYQQHH